MANKFYKVDLEKTFFNHPDKVWKATVWEHIPLLSFHPATWNDPLVLIDFEEGAWFVDIPNNRLHR